MADKRRYIIVSYGGTSLDNKCESLDLEMDTKESLETCAKEVFANVEDILMNTEGNVRIEAYKHGITQCPGGISRNRTNSLPWDKVLNFVVNDKNEREEELKLLLDGLKCGGITHVYVTVGRNPPIVYAIMQVGS